LTERKHLTVWWGAYVTLDAVPGGAFIELWRDGDRDVRTAGTVTLCEPPRLLGLTWADDDCEQTTQVRFRIEPAGSGASLHMSHDGWRNFAPERGKTLMDAHEARWRMHLASFADYAAAAGD
tara:strand:+ start:4341 stop:4706 length:366 start_codon:yes stop_codon:yes gene_type:complete